ncbi:MAG: CE1759 family FMN reductase [Brachybacterium tyrofermentans]|uniref:CE1759 family FMN reductase n=1 Tax=Brachybacterium tyrofermentans TaxID=47848 RepID=A0ABW0FJW5_9MICO|nr:CE1759 family FMN reductase [Brachybacterium tyrofermentans]SLN01944.1 FMN reductase [Corynebacterium xerosis]
MTDTVRLVALSAGLSTPSSTRMLTDQLSRAAATAIGRDGAEGDARIEVDVTTVELREYAHDITDALLTRFPNERLSMVIEAVRAADAVIAVTPVFNVGPSGLFKMLFDAIDIEIWKNKPVLLGATAGTARHSLAIDYAIRPMFGYLKAEVVPTVVFAASADFGADTDGQADEQPLAVRVRRAARELATMLSAGIGASAGGAEAAAGAAQDAAARDAAGTAAEAADGAPAEPTSTLDAEFADFVPMDRLLGRG